MIGIPGDVRERASAVRLLLLDVDGVLTDGTLYYGADGESLKAFNVKDGLGLRMVQHAGIETAVISARNSPALRARLDDLRVSRSLLGRDEKLTALRELAHQSSVSLEQMAFVADDVLDLPVLRAVGLSIAVADAHPMVRAEARWVTERGGGHGAVREVTDGLLWARGELDSVCASLLADVAGSGQDLGA